jgi:hypothetical protein
MDRNDVSTRDDESPDHRDDSQASRTRGLLWLVQLIEYAIGFSIAWAASRTDDPLVPALVSAAVVANAATMKAPLAAFRVSSPQVHRLLGVVLSVAALACAVFLDVDATTKALLIAGAFVEGVVSVRFGHGI